VICVAIADLCAWLGNLDHRGLLGAGYEARGSRLIVKGCRFRVRENSLG